MHKRPRFKITLYENNIAVKQHSSYDLNYLNRICQNWYDESLNRTFKWSDNYD